MPETNYDLGLVSRLTAEAIGEPGQRAFRLLVGSESGSAVLWLEKEQLLELSLSIKRALRGTEEAQVRADQLDPQSESLSVEFKVGETPWLEYVPSSGVFRFWSHDSTEDDTVNATLSFEATGVQAANLSEEGLRVCAAGRPVCRLCHQSIDADGHFCVRSNGHPLDDRERLA